METIRMPRWFHPSGKEMKVLEANSSYLKIAGHAAELKITSIPRNYSADLMVEWNIRHDRSGENSSGVRIFCSTIELAAVFGLTYNGEQGLIAEFNAYELNLNSRFVRAERFLNIPHEGTGMDGDPNISIFITDDIQNAVRNLIEAVEARNRHGMNATAS